MSLQLFQEGTVSCHDHGLAVVFGVLRSCLKFVFPAWQNPEHGFDSPRLITDGMILQMMNIIGFSFSSRKDCHVT